MIRPDPMTRLVAVPALCASLVLLPLLAAAAPRVVTDIGPVQSIVARVMTGMGDPDVLLPPGASPHGHSLRPSDARRLAAAELVVWVGPALTPWLAGPIETLAPQATVLELEEAPGVTLLPIRVDGAFEAHVHADGEEGHEHEHGDEEDHDHGHAHDGHLWLDPANAVAAARAVAAALGEIDPAGASGYAANAEAFAGETATLERRIAAELAPVRGRPYLVFHDAYQYFEHGFDIPAAGSVALQEGVAPGAARVTALRERVRQGGVVCAFTEPQFEPRLLATILEDSNVRTGVLDPIGASLEPGPGLYPALLSDLAASLATCLGAGS